ncbi:MAG: DUF4249 domain-containing protein [Bacteroidota bacterium]
MRVTQRVAYYLVLMTGLVSCTEPISLDLDSGEPQLVVEAEMSNLLESYVVSLAATTDFDGISDRSIAREADVSIIEERSGESLELFEVFPGEYYSFGGDFQGEVGEQYRLRIVLRDGRTYESQLVQIPEPVDIVNINSELREERFLSEDLVEQRVFFQDITARLDNTMQDHFAIFDNRGFVESFIDYPTCGGFDRNNQGSPAGPVRCWAFQDPIIQDISLTSNLSVSGDNYEAVAMSIPFDARGQYVLEVDVKAMDAQSFNFWQQAKDQLDKGDGIFDAPFAPIVGNIRNVDDPDETVLGYFNAYAKSTAQICFEWPAIGTRPTPIVSCSTLCTDFYAPAVFELPLADELCP